MPAKLTLKVIKGPIQGQVFTLVVNVENKDPSSYRLDAHRTSRK